MYGMGYGGYGMGGACGATPVAGVGIGLGIIAIAILILIALVQNPLNTKSTNNWNYTCNNFPAYVHLNGLAI